MKIIILAAAATSALAAGLSHDPCNIKLPITTYKFSSDGGPGAVDNGSCVANFNDVGVLSASYGGYHVMSGGFDSETHIKIDIISSMQMELEDNCKLEDVRVRNSLQDGGTRLSDDIDTRSSDSAPCIDNLACFAVGFIIFIALMRPSRFVEPSIRKNAMISGSKMRSRQMSPHFLKLLKNPISVLCVCAMCDVFSSAAPLQEFDLSSTEGTVVEKVPSYNEDTPQSMDKLNGIIGRNLEQHYDETFEQLNSSSEKPVTSNSEEAIRPFVMEGTDELGTITLPLHRNMESVEFVTNVRDIIVPQLDSLQKMYRDGGSSRDLETANAGSYVLLDGAQYSQCPPGYDSVPEEDCLAAGNALTSEWSTITNRDELNVGDWDDNQCGCLIWDNHAISYDSGCHNAVVCQKVELVCKVQVKTSMQPSTDPSFEPSAGPSLTASNTPSKGPTSSPISSPWTIDLSTVDANFTVNSVEELILSYKVGKNRQENVLPLFMKDCKSNITDTDLLVSTNATAAIPYNSTHKTLVVKHNFNKTLIGDSNVYNATSKKLKVCQIIQLVTDDREMVIIEDKRNIVVDFDLDFNYNISNIALAEAITENESKSVNIDSYVQACKCYSEGTNCDTTKDPLQPNTYLHVCIYSSSADVLIDSLDSMDVKQDNTTFSVIQNKGVKYPSFSLREYIPAARMVKVSTRLPLDIITFSNTGKIYIEGRIVMKLAESPERKLQAANTDSIAEGNEAASFDLVVALDAGFEYEDPGVVSAGMFANNRIGGLVLMFALAFIRW